MIDWLKERSVPVRMTLYAAAAIVAFVIAASVGAVAALIVQGDLDLLGDDAPRSVNEQGNTARQGKQAAGHKEPAEQNEAAEQKKPSEQEEADSRQDEAEYVNKVGDLQGNAVEISLNSHDKLLRYDRLTREDLEDLQANKAALQEIANRVDDLDPPQQYGEQYEAFRSAIDEMHEAAQIAHDLVADPTAATKLKFDDYDRHVNEVDDRLRESNERLGQDYKTIGEVQEISPL